MSGDAGILHPDDTEVVMLTCCPACKRVRAGRVWTRFEVVGATGVPAPCPDCVDEVIDDLNAMLYGLGAALEAPTATLPSEEPRAATL